MLSIISASVPAYPPTNLLHKGMHMAPYILLIVSDSIECPSFIVNSSQIALGFVLLALLLQGTYRTIEMPLFYSELQVLYTVGSSKATSSCTHTRIICLSSVQ